MAGKANADGLLSELREIAGLLTDVKQKTDKTFSLKVKIDPKVKGQLYELDKMFEEAKTGNVADFFSGKDLKGLEHIYSKITEVYDKIQEKRASSSLTTKSPERGELVSWVRAYQASGGEMSSLSQDVIREFERQKETVMGRAVPSLSSFKEIFDILEKLDKIVDLDASGYTKAFSEIREGLSGLKPKTPIISVGDILDTKEVQAKIKELESYVQAFHAKFDEEGDWNVSKVDVTKYIEAFKQLEWYYKKLGVLQEKMPRDDSGDYLEHSMGWYYDQIIDMATAKKVGRSDSGDDRGKGWTFDIGAITKKATDEASGYVSGLQQVFQKLMENLDLSKIFQALGISGVEAAKETGSAMDGVSGSLDEVGEKAKQVEKLLRNISQIGSTRGLVSVFDSLTGKTMSDQKSGNPTARFFSGQIDYSDIISRGRSEGINPDTIVFTQPGSEIADFTAEQLRDFIDLYLQGVRHVLTMAEDGIADFNVGEFVNAFKLSTDTSIEQAVERAKKVIEQIIQSYAKGGEGATLQKAFQEHRLDLSKVLQKSSTGDWIDTFYGTRRQQTQAPVSTISRSELFSDDYGKVARSAEIIEESTRKIREAKGQLTEPLQGEVLPIDEKQIAQKATMIDVLRQSLDELRDSHQTFDLSGGADIFSDDTVQQLVSSLQSLSDDEIKRLGFAETDAEIETFKTNLQELISTLESLSAEYRELWSNTDRSFDDDKRLENIDEQLFQKLRQLSELSESVTKDFYSLDYSKISETVQGLLKIFDVRGVGDYGGRGIQGFVSAIRSVVEETRSLDSVVTNLLRDGMLNFEEDNIPSHIAFRFSDAEEFQESYSRMFSAEADAPTQLIGKFNSFIIQIQNGAMTSEQAFEALKERAKELGITFDETKQKWVQFEAETQDRQIEETGEQSASSFEELNKSIKDVLSSIRELTGALSQISTSDGLTKLLVPIGLLGAKIKQLQEDFSTFFMQDFDENGQIITFSENIQLLVDQLSKLPDALRNATFNTKFDIKIASGKSSMIEQSQGLSDALAAYRRARTELLDYGDEGTLLSALKAKGKFTDYIQSKSMADTGNRADQLSATIRQVELLKQAAEAVGIDISDWEKQFESAAIAAEKTYRGILSTGTQTNPVQEQLSQIFGGGQNVDAAIEPVSKAIDGLQQKIDSFISSLSQIKVIHTIESEPKQFDELGTSVTNINDLLTTKNDLIGKEVQIVDSSIPQEVEQFQSLEFAIQEVIEQLTQIVAILPEIKFDSFVGQESITKIGQLAKDIAQLNVSISGLDKLDAFNHLNEILNAPDQGLEKNLSTIVRLFEDLKKTMNEFGDNGVAVFKSISDLANAGDELVTKMKELFQQAGVKLPEVVAKKKESKTTGESLIATKGPEIQSKIDEYFSAQPGDLEVVETKMADVGDGIVRVIATVSSVTAEGAEEIKRHILEIQDSVDGLSVREIPRDELKQIFPQLQSQTQEITPDIDGWDDLVEKAREFGIEMGSVLKIVRNLNGDYETFKFTMTNGKDVTFDWDEVLSGHDTLLNLPEEEKQYNSLAKSIELSIKKVEDAKKRYLEVQASAVGHPEKNTDVDAARKNLEDQIKLTDELIEKAKNAKRKMFDDDGHLMEDGFFSVDQISKWEDSFKRSQEATSKTAEATINKRKALVEELAQSYVKLVDLEEKARKTEKETGIPDQKAVAEIERIVNRSRGIKARLGILSPEEESKVNAGYQRGVEQQKRYEEQERQAQEKADQEALKKRKALVEELAKSYLKLANEQEKIRKSNKKDGVPDQKAVAEKERLLKRNKEIESELGPLSDEERQVVREGFRRGVQQKKYYEMKTTDISEMKTATQVYNELIKQAEKYYQILDKQRNGKTLTVGDQLFLQKYGEYFRQAGEAASDAGEKIGVFKDKSAEAANAQSQFSEKIQDTLSATIKKNLENAQNIYDQLEVADGSKPDTYKNKLQEIAKLIEELKKLGAQVKVGDEESVDRFYEKLKQVLNAETDIQTSKTYQPIDMVASERLNRQMADWQNKNTRVPKEYMDQIQQYRDMLKSANTQEEFDAVESGFQRVRAAAADAGSVGLSFIDQLKNRMRSFSQYLLSFASFYRIISVLKQAFTIVKDLDSALTEMRKVSDESLSTLQKYQFESFDMADRVGTTAKQIQDSTADWLRLGRTFEQSKTLAEQSTVLLNVSEFENINDATQALVSATQAYDELDAQTIIDKLNLIGNNFAVSTSDLAQGLQNAAAVLKTQGNDIDQSLALLTAGNLIGQDISKASMGVRTISLRISGTEEAKDEIKDMGEDVDDFVVRTKSKTDKIIRDYTAVASNAYKGVSVLDANGNLRDTYDILLDISKIYKEIQEEDKANGTNRAQALVETLAGKTRSNIAASILLNGKVLEDVYNASANDYEGSAQRENEKYLDSIEGRIAKLQNRLQELAFVGFKSDAIKPVIDFFTNAVQLATALVEKIGMLPTLIGAVGGAILQFSGKGLIGSDGNIGFGGIMSAIKDNKFIKRNFAEKIYTPDKDVIMEAAAGSTYVSTEAMLTPGDAGYYDKLTQSGKDFFKQCKAMKIEMIGTKEASDALATSQYSLGSVIKGVGNIFTGFLSTLGTMAITMAASAVIQLIIKGVSYVVNYSKNLIKAGEEAKSTMNQVAQSFDETKNSISGLQEEYAKLSTGVEIDGNVIKNINLSDEEFARYIELSNQIKELAPELVSGYTAQGDAIVNLGNNVDEVNSSFEQYLRVQEQIANGEYGKNLDAMWKGSQEKAAEYKDTIEILQSQIRELQPDTVKDYNGQIQEVIDENTKTFTLQTDPEIGKQIEQLFREHDVVYDYPFASLQTGLTQYTVKKGELSKLSSDGSLGYLNNLVNQAFFNTQSENELLKQQQTSAKILLQKLYMDQVPFIQRYIETNNMFDMIDDDAYSESLQQGLLDMVSRVDYSSIADDVDKNGGIKIWLDKLISIFSVADGELQGALDQLFKLQEERSTLTFKEYAEKRNQLFDTISEKTGFDFYDLAVWFGDATYDEDKNIHWKTSERITSAAEKLKVESLGYSRDDFLKELQKYDSEYSDAALSAIEKIPQDKVSSVADSWESIWEYLKPYLTGEIIAPEVEGTDTLEQFLKSDKLDVSSYTSKLSAIETALSSLYENGFLSDKEKVTLQEALPDLSDFDTDSIKRAGGDALKEYIKYIRDKASEANLTEDAQRDLDTYVTNIAKSYASSTSLNMDEILSRAIFKNHKGFEGAQLQKSIQTALGDRLQGSDAQTIMLMLDADGTLAEGNIEEIVEKWDEYSIALGISINDEDQARIQRELQQIENRQAYNSAQSSYSEFIDGRASRKDRFEAYQLAQDALSSAQEYTQTQIDDWVIAKKSGDDEKAKALRDIITQARTDEVTKQQETAQAFRDYLESTGNEGFEQEEDLERIAKELESQKSIEEKNGTASADTLSAIAKNNHDRADNARELARIFREIAETNPEYEDYFTDLAIDYEQKAVGYEADEYTAWIEQRRIGIEKLEKQLEELQTSSQKTSDEIELLEAQGKNVPSSLYQEQFSNQQDQIDKLVEERTAQYSLRSDLRRAGLVDSEDYKAAGQEIDNLDEKIRQLQIDQINAQKLIATSPHTAILKNLESENSVLEAESKAVTDRISLLQAQGKEITASIYQDQIDIAQQQIRNATSRKAEQLGIMTDLEDRGLTDTQEYKDAEEAVRSLDGEIRQLYLDQVNAQKAMGEIPMLHLQADQTSLEEASQSLQDELSDPRNAPTVSVYVDLIANADDQISNLEQQRAELRRKMAEAESRQDFSVYDTDYVEYRSQLAEVDSQIQQVTQSQLEWRKAILEMPLDKINQQLEEYADKLSRISAARELSEASGRATTEKDYLAEAQAYEGEANLHHRASILRGLEAARLVSSGYSIDSEEVRSVMSQRNQEYTAWMSSRTSALQSRRTADELNLGRIQDQIGLLEQSASQLNDVISLAEARGQAVGALDYQRLIGNADAQIAQNEQLISEYESLMAKWTPEQGSEIWKTYVEGIDNATSQITQLQQSQVEWHDTIMQLGLTDLQNEQADLERQITVAEQEHHKVSEKTYRDLLKNGERQIKNLRAQQRGLDKMEPKYREIQGQIDQVSDSMREWENTADHLAAVAGQNLSSAITSAMSEINSETGLTRETMDSLLQSFDDLTAYDLSGLFYESADGMKLNVGMAQDLIDAQYELTMSGYEKTIAEQNKIIAENTGLQDENAQAALAAAQRRKLAAEQDMAIYQAQYNVQNQALSSFQAWQNATQTKNAGANYETYQGAWKGIQEAYTKGLTGTDDFRTYVAFFDRWGQDTVEAYKRNKQKISRYITEGSTGVDNFIKDLVAKGYGEKNAEGGYDVSLSDVEDISRDLQISEDAVRMMINRGEDYGWIVTMVDTVQEGGLKISDTTHDLIQETLRYQEMLANGATADELKNQKDYIDELTTSIGDYTDSINELDEEHGKITSTRLQTELDKISALQQFLDNEELTAGMPEGVKAKFEEDINEAIQQISDETGIPLKVNADTSNFEVDQEKLQQQFDGFKPKITIDEITDESFTNARKELTEIPSLTEAAEGVLGVGENDLMGSTFTKLQDGWEENKESLGDYIDQLNGLNLSQEAIDNIETLDFADGGYTKGLEEFESILDNVAKMFGITADEAQYLLPILEALGLVNITGNAQTWTKPISSIMGTEVGALDSWIRKNENAEVDLDFDPTEMSVDELGEKIKEISKLKVQIDADPEAGDEVKTQYRELMHSLTQQYGMQKKVDRMYQMTGLTADDFLALDEEGRKQVMVDIGVNPEDYDSFIESAQNQSIAVKIEGALKDGQTVEDLLAIEDDTEFANALGIDEDSVEAARQMLQDISMEPYKTAGQTIADQIEDKSSSIGSKIGTGFIEAVTGFIDLLTGGENEADTTSYSTLPKSTADTTSYQPEDNHAPLPQAGQGSTVVDKHVTEFSVEGAKEGEAEVAGYTKTIDEVPTSKETTITTTHETINRTVDTTSYQPEDNHANLPSAKGAIDKGTESSGGTINVSVNVQGKEQVDALKQSIDDIEGKNVDVRASVYGIGTVSTLNNQISKVTGKDVSINASVNGFALVSGLVSKMNELQDKKVTITTEHKTVMTRAGQYTGSVTGTPYTAHASGTAYNMLNLTPKTEANAAGNDVSIQKTGKSLVNELGQESLITRFLFMKWVLSLCTAMYIEKSA